MKHFKLMGTVLAVLMLLTMTGCTFLADDNFTPVTKASQLLGTWEYTQEAKDSDYAGVSAILPNITVNGKVTGTYSIKKVEDKYVLQQSASLKIYLTKQDGTFAEADEKGLETLFKSSDEDPKTGAKSTFSVTLSGDKKTITISGKVTSPKLEVTASDDDDVKALNLGNTVQINSMGNRLKLGEGDDAITLKKKGLF